MSRTERKRSNVLEAEVGQRPACEVSKLELVSSGLVGDGDSGWISPRGSGQKLERTKLRKGREVWRRHTFSWRTDMESSGWRSKRKLPSLDLIRMIYNRATVVHTRKKQREKITYHRGSRSNIG